MGKQRVRVRTAGVDRRSLLGGGIAAAITGAAARLGLPETVSAQDAPLPSWNDSAAKAAILTFVAAAIDEGNDDFVPVADRIATFDQDGALWVEQPIYGQAVFAIDRVQEMAPGHPDWATTEPYATLLSGNEKAPPAVSTTTARRAVCQTLRLARSPRR